jgi:hypothetical protein
MTEERDTGGVEELTADVVVRARLTCSHIRPRTPGSSRQFLVCEPHLRDAIAAALAARSAPAAIGIPDECSVCGAVRPSPEEG